MVAWARGKTSKHRQHPITGLALASLIEGHHAELEPLAALLAGDGDFEIGGGADIDPGLGTFLAALDLVGGGLAALPGRLPMEDDAALASVRRDRIPRLSGGREGGSASAPAPAPADKPELSVVEIDGVFGIAQVGLDVVDEGSEGGVLFFGGLFDRCVGGDEGVPVRDVGGHAFIERLDAHRRGRVDVGVGGKSRRHFLPDGQDGGLRVREFFGGHE